MGRRFPDGGLLRYRKWVPQQLGDVADRQPTNGSAAQRHGSQSHGFAVRVWLNLCICCPGVVELVRSNLGTSFPLFHVFNNLTFRFLFVFWLYKYSCHGSWCKHITVTTKLTNIDDQTTNLNFQGNLGRTDSWHISGRDLYGDFLALLIELQTNRRQSFHNPGESRHLLSLLIIASASQFHSDL